MSYGVGHKCGSNPVLLWLWYKPAAVALMRPLAWESPYAAGAALKSKKRKKKKKKKKNQQWSSLVAQQVKDLVFVTAVVQVTVVAWVQLLAWELPNTVGAANKK